MKKEKRTFFIISDTHGSKFSFRIMENLINKGFDINNPHHFFIHLGDVIDNKTDEANTKKSIIGLIELKEIIKDRYIQLLGNHDEFFINFVENLEAEDFDKLYAEMGLWVVNGGIKTLSNFIVDEQKRSNIFNKAILKKLENLKKIKQTFSLYLDLFNNKAFYYKKGGIDEKFKELVINIFRKDIVVKEKFIKNIKKIFIDDKDLLNELVEYKNFLNNSLLFFETEYSIFVHSFATKDRFVDIWSRESLSVKNETNKNMYVGHIRFPSILKDIQKKTEIIKTKITEIIKTDDNIYFIDNGKGNNIVIVEE